MAMVAPVNIGFNEMTNEESSDSMKSSLIIELPMVEPMTKMLWKTLNYH